MNVLLSAAFICFSQSPDSPPILLRPRRVRHTKCLRGIRRSCGSVLGMGRSAGAKREQGCEQQPVPEELGCGPFEEQWIASKVGCITKELLDAVDEGCLSDAESGLEEEAWRDEISSCDAMVHPNIADLLPPGPKAILEPTSILVVNKVGELDTRVVKLQNVGTTCLFYSWERISKESIVEKKKVVGRHVTDCWTFSVMKFKGSLLSGETQEFSFKFTSDVPGTFMETWELTTAPKLINQSDLLRVSVKGFALVDDTKRENRKRLDKVLDFQEVQSRYINEFLTSMFERVVAGTEWTPPTPPTSPLTQRSRCGKKKKAPKLPCLRTLKAYHDRWIPNCPRAYDISPLTSPPGD